MGAIKRVEPITRGKNTGKFRAIIIEGGHSKSLGIFEKEVDAQVAFEFSHLSATQSKPAKPKKIDIDEWNRIAKQQRIDFAQTYS